MGLGAWGFNLVRGYLLWVPDGVSSTPGLRTSCVAGDPSQDHADVRDNFKSPRREFVHCCVLKAIADRMGLAWAAQGTSMGQVG